MTVGNGEWTDVLAPLSSAAWSDALQGLFQKAQEFVAANLTGDKTRLPRVVLVSRRLSCIYSMACAAGMPELDADGQCEVVFDRALGLNPEWGSSPILVIDDVLVHGTTMTDRVGELKDALPHATDIQVRVAMVCAEKADRSKIANLWDHSLLDPETGLPNFALKCTTKEAETLASDLAVCLYRSRTPYFTDFPIVGRGGDIRMAAESLDTLLASPDWLVADVTLPIGREGQAAYTFVPNSDLRQRILQRLDPRAAELCELLKIRVFVDTDSDGLRKLQIVPIAIPGPALVEDLDATLTSLSRSLGTNFSVRHWQPETKHRLVQMYLSTVAMSEFWNDLANACDRSCGELTSERLDQLHIRSFFESKRVDLVLATFDATVAQHAAARKSESTEHPYFFGVEPKSAPRRSKEVRLTLEKLGWQSCPFDEFGVFGAPAEPAPGDVSIVSVPWAQRGLELWAYIADNFQSPLQDLLAQNSVEQNLTPQEVSLYSERYGRFRVGFQASDLKSLVREPRGVSEAWASALPTLMLDIGNDLGIAVPSTHYEGRQKGGGSAVYRQYRPGENAPFARAGTEQLAHTDPLETYTEMGGLLKWWAVGGEHRKWGSLTRAEKDCIRRIGNSSQHTYDRTTLGGQITVVRELLIERSDDVSVSGMATGATYDGPGDPALLPTALLLSDESVTQDDLVVGRRLKWVTVALPHGGIAQRFYRID